MDRYWPELFEALRILMSEDAEAIAQAREEADRKRRQQEAVVAAKRRYG